MINSLMEHLILNVFMNFDATKKIKHCYTRTIAQKIDCHTRTNHKKNVAIKCIILCQKGKYQEAKFGMNIYESKLIKDQLMDK